MNKKEILDIAEKLQESGISSVIVDKIYRSLSAIEEKDKRIAELEELGDEAFHEERYIDSLGTIQNRNAIISFKDKEIAELKEAIENQDNSLIVKTNVNNSYLAEISALKEEVERLKNIIDENLGIGHY